MRFVLTLFMTLIATSCSADDFMRDRTQRNMAKLKSYRGTFVERGVLPGDEMRSEVIWKKPDRFLSRVLSPTSYAGVTLAYTGDTLVLYYPMAGYAIRWEHLTPPTVDDEKQLVALAYDHNVKTYDYTVGNLHLVGKHSTVGLDYRAKKKGAYSPSGTSNVVDKFSFPIEGRVDLQGGASYAYRFDDIDFNGELSDALFQVELPKNVILSRWDMASPSLTESQLREQANFEVSLIAKPGMAEERIVKEGGPVPAFTIVYRRGPRFLLHTMYRDTGIRPTAVEHGIPTDSPGHTKKGHLLIGPTLSYFGFTHKGTRHMLIGNLPFDELAALADEIP